MHKENPLPHHWMAPENFDEKKFTEKSEIWSYAVCLWELFTLGDIPYQEVEDMLKYLSVGRRLPQPNYCSKEIYDFMKGCWDLDPSKRPTFSECVKFFEKQLELFTKEQPLNKPTSNNA
ncbi:hypothetical protein CAEBREN_14028 [Caenorhabditis brenneri]|uniref:Protein kinase domain-containing protein n=1 Tax=Caenorhabditis brenneri TaxID=135651 RepID=G0NF19_CAEBE|nr:hypothetical protein CAEBREN_14028 [Caenorhabditis brenneri]